MGEAIITSRGGTQEEAVPVVPGYHSILATVRDYQGKLLKDYPINCKDGSVWYNYKTNESGKVLFTCNSGAANISINNVINGYRYLDFPNHIINCDCPIGGQTRLSFNIPKTKTISCRFGAGTSKVRFLHNQECSGYIVGGGGGGGACSVNYTPGSGGGGGWINYFNNLSYSSNYNIDIYVGQGGKGGHAWGFNGNAGETSTFDGKYSANGGGAGSSGFRLSTHGFGNGGSAFNNGSPSGDINAGGGGSGGVAIDRSWSSNRRYGGSPYGGNAITVNDLGQQYGYKDGYGIILGEDGKIPGGGGAGGSSGGSANMKDGYYCFLNISPGRNGAAGICVINLVNY